MHAYSVTLLGYSRNKVSTGPSDDIPDARDVKLEAPDSISDAGGCQLVRRLGNLITITIQVSGRQGGQLVIGG